MSAASSTASERDERVFTAAFGIMDSNQDGEAVAAFMRVREILRRHGGGFRRLLERSHEAERLNEELGRQNAQLLRENAALRARDSRPAAPAGRGGTGLFFIPSIPAFTHWDIALTVIIAVFTGSGLLDVPTAFAVVAVILVCAALTKWFSPVRFFVGVLLGLAAFGTAAPRQPAPVGAATRPAGAPAPTMPAAIYYPAADAAPQRQSSADKPAPAALTAAAADSAPEALTDTSSPPRQTLADLPPPPHAIPDLQSRRTSAEPRTKHGTAAKTQCGPYRLQPGFNCPRSNQWRRDFFPDFGRPLTMRYE